MREFEIITALVTPFKANGNIDINSFINLINYQVENGITSFVIFGTTGEGNTIKLKQKITAIKKIRKVFKNSIYLMCGISHTDTQSSIEDIKILSKYDIDSFLVLSPSYLKTNDEGIIKHFNSIADASKKLIYIYCVPKRTGQIINPNIYQILRQHPMIQGVKVATDSRKYFEKTLHYQNANFQIYSGEDLMFLDSINMNSNGIISVASNAFPRLYKEIVNLYLTKKEDLASKLFNEYQSLIEVLFLEPNPIPIKYYLSLNKKIELHYHLPLTNPSKEIMSLIKERYKTDI